MMSSDDLWSAVTLEGQLERFLDRTRDHEAALRARRVSGTSMSEDSPGGLFRSDVVADEHQGGQPGEDLSVENTGRAGAPTNSPPLLGESTGGLRDTFSTYTFTFGHEGTALEQRSQASTATISPPGVAYNGEFIPERTLDSDELGRRRCQQLFDAAMALLEGHQALLAGRRDDARVEFARVLTAPLAQKGLYLSRSAQLGLAQVAEAEGDLSTAIDRLTSLYGLLPEHLYEPDQQEAEQRTEIAITLCRCLREAGRLAEAIQVGEAALAVDAAQGWSERSVELGASVLDAHLERCPGPTAGEVTICHMLAAFLVEAAERLDTPRALSTAYASAAVVAAMAGEAERSRHFDRQALAASHELRDLRPVRARKIQLARTLLLTAPNEPGHAQQHVRQARGTLKVASGAIDAAYQHLVETHIDLLIGHPAKAAKHAEEIARRHPTARCLTVAALLLQGQALRACEVPQAAAEAYVAAGEVLEQMTAPGRAAQAFADAASALMACGDVDASTITYQRALDVVGLTGI
ncbi:hypothetical protein [Nonomuraea sp. NPDC049400]|uniref:hypothetical protein n=1 Tax=Nonomuraea sp. NPDC049400 TaxID=3364352 RepID=UPI0037B5643B